MAGVPDILCAMRALTVVYRVTCCILHNTDSAFYTVFELLTLRVIISVVLTLYLNYKCTLLLYHQQKNLIYIWTEWLFPSARCIVYN